MSMHYDFILSPITGVLRDSVSASAGIGSGIETYPLCDYIMQSTFLKMTGFQEQKMKCICWELATNDYEYRYKRYNLKSLGECSCYEEKNVVYKDLIAQIKENEADFNASSFIDKVKILSNSILEVKSILSNTNFSIWAQSDFESYENTMSKIEPTCLLLDKGQLFSNCDNCPNGGRNRSKCLSSNNLKEIHEKLVRHRNKCAHNTQSYQQNLPTLKTLISVDYKYENYFVRFALLVLIDEIFIELYKKYLDVCEN